MKRNIRGVVGALLATMLTVDTAHSVSTLSIPHVVQDDLAISVAGDSTINFTIGTQIGTRDQYKLGGYMAITLECSTMTDTTVSMTLYNIVNSRLCNIGADSLVITPTAFGRWNGETRVFRTVGRNMRAVVSTTLVNTAKFRISYRFLDEYKEQ